MKKSYDDVHVWLLGHPGRRDGGGRCPDEEADRGRGEGGDQEGKVQPVFLPIFVVIIVIVVIVVVGVVVVVVVVVAVVFVVMRGKGKKLSTLNCPGSWCPQYVCQLKPKLLSHRPSLRERKDGL